METFSAPLAHAHSVLMQHVEVHGSKYPLRSDADPVALLRESGIDEPERMVDLLHTRHILKRSEIDGAERLLVDETFGKSSENGLQEKVEPNGSGDLTDPDYWLEMSKKAAVSPSLRRWIVLPDRNIALIIDFENYEGMFAKAKQKVDAKKLLDIARRRGRVVSHEIFAPLLADPKGDVAEKTKGFAEKYERARFDIRSIPRASVRGSATKDMVDQHVVIALAKIAFGKMGRVDEVICCFEDQHYVPVLNLLKDQGIKITTVLPTKRDTSSILDMVDDIEYMYEGHQESLDDKVSRAIIAQNYVNADTDVQRRIRMLATMIDIMAYDYRIDDRSHGFNALLAKLCSEKELREIDATSDEIRSGLSLLNNGHDKDGNDRGLRVIVRKSEPGFLAAYKINKNHAFVDAANDIRRTPIT